MNLAGTGIQDWCRREISSPGRRGSSQPPVTDIPRANAAGRLVCGFCWLPCGLLLLLFASAAAARGPALKSTPSSTLSAPPAHRSAPPASLLVNGGFEDGTGPNAVPGWSLQFWPGQQSLDGAVTRSQEHVHSGKWALKVDSGPFLGRDGTMVFNATIRPEAAELRGQPVELSGWIYVPPGSAIRPINLRLRQWGATQAGGAFKGDALSRTVVGVPGRWTRFSGGGTIAPGAVTSLDLECSQDPDVVRAVEFLDDFRLTPVVAYPLDLTLPERFLWCDAQVIPASLALHELPAAASVSLRLMDSRGRSVATWKRPAASGLYALALRTMPAGVYTLAAEARDGAGHLLASGRQSLTLVASPWEGAVSGLRGRGTRRFGDAPAAGFLAMGTAAPTNLPDAVAATPEPLSPDLLGRVAGVALVPFSRGPMVALSTRARPRPGETGWIRLFGCPGQYVPVQLGVWARRDLQDVRVVPGDLKGPHGVLSARSIDVRVTRSITGIPEFLEKRTSITIPTDQTARFWVTVHLPADAPPGNYEGPLNIFAAGQGRTQFPLFVRILPLHLPSAHRGFGFWWAMDRRWHGYYSETRPEALAQIRKQFVLLREHGCSMVSCDSVPEITRDAGGAYHFDFEQEDLGNNSYSLADFVRLGKNAGFFRPGVPIQYTGAEEIWDYVPATLKLDVNSPAWDAFYRQICRAIDSWTRAHGIRFAFACVDEIGNSVERQQKALRAYADATQAGVLTSCTDNSTGGGHFLTLQPRFSRIIQMRLYDFLTPELIRYARTVRNPAWAYNLGSMGWDPAKDRLAFGLFLNRTGAAGSSQWAFQWPQNDLSPWDASALGKETGWDYALPAPDGPLPTVALETIREGITDGQYFDLLQKQSPAAAQKLLGPVPNVSSEILPFLSDHGGDWFEIMRWEAARAVIHGSGVAGPPARWLDGGA